MRVQDRMKERPFPPGTVYGAEIEPRTYEELKKYLNKNDSPEDAPYDITIHYPQQPAGQPTFPHASGSNAQAVPVHQVKLRFALSTTTKSRPGLFRPIKQ